MTPAAKSQPPILFSVELHSDTPERLVAFYQELLGITFTETTYPRRRYLCEMGRVALSISTPGTGASPCNADNGRVTLSFLSSALPPSNGERYFLHPKRPLAREFPERYALRIQDPDGNYIAFAKSLDCVLGKIPLISSWRGLLKAAKDLSLSSLYRLQTDARSLGSSLIDRTEYVTGRSARMTCNLSGYSHVVGSREGLFAVNKTSYKRILRGQFFGVTVRDNSIYCFQSCGLNNIGRKGRIVRLTLDAQQIREHAIVVKGLDDGCHQIDFIGNDLMVVDCYNGRLLQIDLVSGTSIGHYPLGRLNRDIAMNEYHINSITRSPDGNIWVLLHNSNKRPSEVIVLDRAFSIVRRFQIDAGAAHNIVFTNDPFEYIIADSRGGRLISALGTVVEGDLMMPRGVSLDDQMCVLGDSFFATRPFRKYVPGRIHFYDRFTWSRMASLSLPAAPTEIRRIDGHDFSLSNCVATAKSREGTAIHLKISGATS